MTQQNQLARAEWPRVLTRGEHRVELYLLPMDDERHVLVALSGAQWWPERVKGQGPFPDLATARGVARRVLESLRSSGYEHGRGERWKLDAWRHRRAVLDERARTPLRTAFHPDDVLD